MLERRCGNCAHAIVPTSKTGARVVRADTYIGCTAPMPVLPPVPPSWTIMRRRIPVRPEYGADCPEWVKYQKGKSNA